MKNKSSVILSSFEQLVKKALKCFDDPQRLGEESPLASHYFLGPYLLDQVQIDNEPVNDALARGRALSVAIRQAAARLWGAPLPKGCAEMKIALKEVRKLTGTARYAYLVLELRCFQDYFKLPRTADIWENDDYLPGSQSAHYRDFDLAVVYLSNALLDQLHPTLRFEQPKAPTMLVGYQAQLESAGNALAQGKTVTVSGAGGTGKSALAANIVQALAADVPAKPGFWFTVRPKFNDHLNSLLFALGHFLHSQGGSRLWQAMVAASNGSVAPDVALALTRQDLAAMDNRTPVLCFDDFDLLFAADPENEEPAHRQIIEFVEGMRGDCALLVIGQRPLLEADCHIHLEGFAVVHVAEIFQLHHQYLSANDALQLHHFTRGNPRMVLLCLALQQSGEPLAETIRSLPQSPALSSLLHRLWRCLAADERRMLQRLSVFRRAAPILHSQLDNQTVQRLIDRQLIHIDRLGGIELLPALRTRIYDELSPDLRVQLHLEAAETRLLHGETTAAAYHFWHGHNPSAAIAQWHPKRAAEIKRGQADLAFEIFTNIPHLGLNKEESQMLSLIQAELYKLRGGLEEGLASMEMQDWSGNPSGSAAGYVEAAMLRGEFLEMLGQPEAAQQVYSDGISATHSALRQLVTLHHQRSMLHLRQKEMAAAWHEADLAECQLLLLRGELEEERARYDDALASLQKAHSIAQRLDERLTLAQINRRLANIYGRLQKIDKAEEHGDAAIDYYEQIGDHFSLAKMYDNLAFFYIQDSQYAKAIDVGSQALVFFKAAKSPYYLSIVAVNLAHSYLELGNLEKAQAHLQEALDCEETQSYPYALRTLGRIQGLRGNWQAAQKSFEQAIQFAQQNGDQFAEAYIQRDLGKALLVQDQQCDAGREMLQRALESFEHLQLEKEVLETRKLLDQAVTYRYTL